MKNPNPEKLSYEEWSEKILLTGIKLKRLETKIV
jgi:hypothetical protein